MTARQIFEGMLVELSKVNAPSLLLEDFNYLFNKAIYQYINKRYNIYDISQQQTDDIRVLKSTAILTPTKSQLFDNAADNTYSDVFVDAESYLSQAVNPIASLYGATYEVNLPKDYLHVLNCICIYKINKQIKCYDKGSIWQQSAKRLTADSWSTIINDYYNRPSYKNPYFYIHNVNISNELPTQSGDLTDGDYKVLPSGGIDIKEIILNDLITNKNLTVYTTKFNSDSNRVIFDSSTHTIDDIDYNYTYNQNKDNELFKEVTPIESNFDRIISIGKNTINLVEKDIAVRVGNPSNVRMEIRYGKDSSVFELVQVLVDYIKVPQHIRLTQEQLDLTEDTSQIMEFPDYVCQEIINELVHIVMENTADPRLQSHIPVSQSIANPAQAQAPQQAQQAQ